MAVVVFSLASGLDERTARARMLRDRLASLDRAQERQPSEELALLRDELLSEIPALDQMLRRSVRVQNLQHFLHQGDMQIRAGKFLTISAVLGLVCGVLGFELSNRLEAGIIFFALGGALPYFYASYLRTQRFHKFEEMFPEAIELLGRAIRAGHAFTTAIELIGNELGEPVAGEFRKMFEEQKFGLPVRDALLNLAERIPLIDVKFFVTSVMLQRETGGNLAEILDKLSYVIRERFKILRQVRVYT
ncbi:MAG: type II secretion system F family protein, partial [Longimicrobiales bacterium]